MANDFSGDSNCVALWKFESGSATTDSKGGNTLTDHNAVTISTADYKEGSASADFNGSNEWFSIADTDLDAGFPFRDTDSFPNDDISVCFWMKPDVLALNDYIFSKYAYAANKRTFVISLYLDNKIGVAIGYNNGADAEGHNYATALATDKWYHVGITFDNKANDTSVIRIRIWDGNAGALLGTDYTTSAAKTINIEDAVLCIADAQNAGNRLYNGHLDELVVFKDILTVAEIDKIRNGTYDEGVLKIKSINGVTFSNIKSINGVARADIKSINSIT